MVPLIFQYSRVWHGPEWLTGQWMTSARDNVSTVDCEQVATAACSRTKEPESKNHGAEKAEKEKQRGGLWRTRFDVRVYSAAVAVHCRRRTPSRSALLEHEPCGGPAVP